jgi:DNA mismatch endonuclease, patch repair protein
MDSLFGKPITKEKRAQIMSRVKSSNTKFELRVFKQLEDRGLKFEKHFKMLGNPDIVFTAQKVVVFLDSDFWHGWDFKSWSKSLSPYWYKKIKKTIRRDIKIRKQLKSEGWTVLRCWEHDLNESMDRAIKKIIKALGENK